MRILTKSETNTRDIAKDYRETVQKLIDNGSYDHNQKFKEAAINMVKTWDHWANLNLELMSYGPFKMLFGLPWYLSLNSKIGKAYSAMNDAQDLLNEINRESNFDKKKEVDDFKEYMETQQ